MAKRSVAQMSAFGKVEFNPKVNFISEAYKMHSNPLYQQAGYALSMSNDDAVEFLRENGFAQIIPGTHFAPAKDVAKFFEVSVSSLHAYVNRHKLSRPYNPIEVISCELNVFFRKAGLQKVGKETIIKNESGGSGTFDFHFTKTDTHYVTEWGPRTRFYSARIILAMVPFMAHHFKRYNSEHPTVTLYNKLVWILAIMRDEEKKAAEQKAAEEEAAKQVEIQKAEAEKKSAELKADIAEDTLYELIKKAVSEVMSGAKISLASSEVNT